MKGVLLAGGNGTRLRPATNIVNKHLLLVYDRPMIYYPIQTLKDMGCNEIIIVSGGENIGGFADALKDGSDFNVKFTYRIQPEAGGIAQALGCVEGLAEGLFPVILGDNYFSKAIKMPSSPSIFVKEVHDPERFGVYEPSHRQIIEKPKHPLSNLAVLGLYVYDERVFDIIKTLKPSARGEYEITDINNWYLGAKDGLAGAINTYNGYWSDCGTHDSLNDAANYIRENQN